MKKTLALTLLLTASAAHGNGDIYMGASIGKAKGDETLVSLNQRIVAANIDGAVGVFDTVRDTYSLTVGGDVNDWLALEMAYTDLGDVDVRFYGNGTSVNALINNLKGIKALTAEGYSMRLRASMPIIDGIDVYGRLGAFIWQADYVIHGDGGRLEVDESGSDWDWAIGSSYRFHPRWSAKFEWGQYELDDAVGAVSLGLLYHFESQ